MFTAVGDTERFIARLILILGIAFIGVALTLDFARTTHEFFGDEAVYYCMTESLARDFDLQYTRQDLERVYRFWPRGPQGILLTASDQDYTLIHYAKPILFPLMAAPFFRIVGLNGFLVLHAILLILVIAAGYRTLRYKGSPAGVAILFTLVFVFLSVIYVYVFQITPEFSSFAMIFLGLYLAFTAGEGQWRRQVLAAVLIGVNAAGRPPNAVMILPVFGAALEPALVRLWRKRLRSRVELTRVVKVMILVGLAFAAALAIYLVAVRGLTGQWFSHGGFRKRIVGHFPFEAPGITFLNTGDSISTRTTKFIFHWPPLLFNSFYFFFGRFTGMTLYHFPAFVCVLLFLLRRKDVKRWLLFLALVISIWFHLVYIPTNYHGGSGAVGNRYFMHFCAGFFFLLPAIRSYKPILFTGLIASLFTARLTINPLHTVYRYDEHTKSPPFTWFPIELSLLGSWPTDDIGHSRITFGSDSGYMLYLADDNTYGKELDGLWVRGDAPAEMVVRAWEPVTAVTLSVANGPRPNRVSLRVAGVRKSIGLLPGERRDVVFPVRPDFTFYNLEGAPSYLYHVVIHSREGFIPRFEGNSNDARFLGCHVAIKLGNISLAAALDLKRQGNYDAALAIFQNLSSVSDETIKQRAVLEKTLIDLRQGAAAALDLLPSTVFPENLGAVYDLYRAQGNAQLALQAVEREWALWPDRSGPLDRLLTVLPQDDHRYESLVKERAVRFTPSNPCSIQFGPGIKLLGWQATKAAERTWSLTQWWEATKPIEADYAIFVHLVKGTAPLRFPKMVSLLRRLRLIDAYRFQADHGPLEGRWATSHWIPGEILRDSYQVVRPKEMPGGSYSVIVGLWDPAGSRSALPITAASLPIARRGVVLGVVEL